MYVVAGGYAVDCVKNGYLDYFEEIVDAMGYIIESYLVGWIHDKGGWVIELCTNTNYQNF